MRQRFRLISYLLVTLFGIIGASAYAETRALLVGVWKFESPAISDLEGPENDLIAMERLLRRQGASDVTVLRNDGVTRTTFETALHALGLRSKPGDWIVVYYSGHGAQSDAAVRGTKDGDSDQFLPLAHFDLERQDAERFIVDKDLYAWVARYVPSSVRVFMMADACHSGTMHRSIDARAWRFTPRMAFRGEGSGIKLASRPAPRFPGVLGATPSTVEVTRADLPNQIFIGAALDDQLALEAALPAENGIPRGLLTYSFEQALTTIGPDGKSLAGDADRDGHVSVGEIATYLNTQVRALTGQRQEPSAYFSSSVDRTPLFEAAVKPIAAALPTTRPLASVFVSGGSLPSGATTPGYRLVAQPHDADFVWELKTATVLRRTGDVVAEQVSSATKLAGVVETWSTLDALRPLLGESRGRITIGPGQSGARYRAGETVAVGLDVPPVAGPRYATIFNLASDGTVQPLYPLDGDGDGLVSASKTLSVFDSRVVAPFGADHVVALVSSTAPTALRTLLRTTAGQRGAARLVPAIKAVLGADRNAGLSVGEIYSGP